MTETTKKNLEIIGKNVRATRKAQNLTQEELANIIKMERKHLSSIENGIQNITLDTFFKISNALNVNPLDLFKEN